MTDDIDDIIANGIVFKGMPRHHADDNRVKTKAKKKKYITGVHSTAASKNRTKKRQQRTQRLRNKKR